MAANKRTPLPMLEEDERCARVKLAAYRARLYRHDGASPMAIEIRLRELERRWQGAADRLRRAKKSGS